MTTKMTKDAQVNLIENQSQSLVKRRLLLSRSMRAAVLLALLILPSQGAYSVRGVVDAQQANVIGTGGGNGGGFIPGYYVDGSPVLGSNPLIGRLLTLDGTGIQIAHNVKDQPPEVFPVRSFKWTVDQKPQGSAARLLSENTLTPRIWLDRSGLYKISFSACPEGCLLDNGNRLDADQGARTTSVIFWAYSTGAPKSIRFLLDDFVIHNTMSGHEDTDFVILTAKVGDRVVTQRAEKIGDLNNGRYHLGWELGSIPLDGPVVISYQIVNKGHADQADVLNAAKAIAGALATVGSAVGLPGAAVVGALGTVLGWFFPDCDGVVLSDNVVITDPNTVAKVPPKPVSKSYTGPDTNWGCGSNAKYDVNYTVIPEWTSVPAPAWLSREFPIDHVVPIN